MAYQIEFTEAARRDLRTLQRDLLLRVNTRILNLADNPRPRGTETLQGSRGLRRLRIGDYRIIYAPDDPQEVVTIARVRHRRDVYRGL